MDNDLPTEPNDYMAAAYADLAHQARLRTNAMKAVETPDAEHLIAELQAEETEGKLQRLADLYSERRELTTGYRR